MLAVGVAKGVNVGVPDVGQLAVEALAADRRRTPPVEADDVEIDTRWLGPGLRRADGAGRRGDPLGGRARRVGARRTYTGKGFAGLLGNAATGRWRPGTEVVFLHTGGLPAVFTEDGAPSRRALASP